MVQEKLAVFLRPRGLHKKAPTITPGNAMAPRRSCHSAVRFKSPSWIILEIIVPENTPFGNVMKSYKNLIG